MMSSRASKNRVALRVDRDARGFERDGEEGERVNGDVDMREGEISEGNGGEFLLCLSLSRAFSPRVESRYTDWLCGATIPPLWVKVVFIKKLSTSLFSFPLAKDFNAAQVPSTSMSESNRR